MTQIRFTAGYGADYQHESVSFSHALLAATEKLNVIAAILPGPWHPAVVAKQVASISWYTGGRLAVNIVSGWFRGEFQAIGEHWLDHDERYRRSEEFIRVLRGVWSQDNFSFAGDFYRFRDYTLKPKPVSPPEIFQGGSSRAARDMAARVSDWYFTNGNTIDGIRKQVDDIRAKAAQSGHQVKIGVNAFAIVRDTAEEARAALNEILDECRSGGGSRVSITRFRTPARRRRSAKAIGRSRASRISSNTMTGSRPISSARRKRSRGESWISRRSASISCLLGFLHFQEEVEFFGKRVIPLVRALEAEEARRPREPCERDIIDRN